MMMMETLIYIYQPYVSELWPSLLLHTLLFTSLLILVRTAQGSPTLVSGESTPRHTGMVSPYAPMKPHHKFLITKTSLKTLLGDLWCDESEYEEIQMKWSYCCIVNWTAFLIAREWIWEWEKKERPAGWWYQEFIEKLRRRMERPWSGDRGNIKW